MGNLNENTRGKKFFKSGDSNTDRAFKNNDGEIVVPPSTATELSGMEDISDLINDNALYQVGKYVLKPLEDLRLDIEDIHAFLTASFGRDSSTAGFDGKWSSLTNVPSGILSGSQTQARTQLGVDPAGKDNSTDVSLAGSYDYITISGQTITRNQINLATDVTGTLPVGNMAATALTTVQTAANESAHLALTAQEGDVVVRSDENKTYMHNGGTAGTMADFTELATPTDSVTSVNGNTGAVTVVENVTTNLSTTANGTSLTINSSDGTNASIPAATTSAWGAMTDEDKSKLNNIDANANNYSLPLGTSTTRGGFKIGYSENGKNYPVEVSNEKMYVNVPWTDNNTTYSTATSSTLGLVKIGYTENGKNYPVELSNGQMYVNVPWTDTDTNTQLTTAQVRSKISGTGLISYNSSTGVISTTANNYSLPAGTSTTRGGFKIGYSENGKNYPVEVSNEKMYVNVPWTDTNTNTQLSTEQVQDIVGGMVSSNTETNISVTYDDTNGKLNFVSTDTNTWRGIHDSPVDGATTTSISSNWAFDNVKTAVPTNAVFTDTTYTVGDGGLTQKNFTTTLKNKLDNIAANANNYTHPTHPGDDISIDTGALTGATVISDLDFNVTTDTLGHVTDANATISTRNLTAADIGAAASSHNHDSRYYTETESDAKYIIGSTQNQSHYIHLNQNPVGTTYGDTVSTVPSYYLGQKVGDNDGWRLYGEAPSSNDVKMVFEVIDDIEAGDTWIFRNKKTYSPYTANDVVIIEGNGDITTDGEITLDGRLRIGTVDTNTSSTSALVLNGTEVEKRTLGTAAFSSTSDFAPSSHNQAWSTITGTPTTLAGYGITDALSSTTPNAPTNLSLSIVNNTVNVTFDASTTSNIDLYLIFSSANGGDYSLVSVIPPDDFSSTMSIIDDSFDDSGTQAYRVYAQKNGIISSALSGNITYTVPANVEPTNMSVVNLNSAFYIQWDPPSSNARFVTAYNVYKHEHSTQSSLSRSSATLVYSGMNTSYMYQITGNNNTNFHQFWVETTTT